MKVALVHDWLTGFRGGEKCLEVLCRLFPDAELYTLLRRPGSTSPAIERMKISTSFLQRVPGIAKHYRYFLPLMPLAVERLQLPADVDLVVSLSHAVAKNIRPPAGVPHVCYCFTPMRYAWHMQQQYFGEAAARLQSSAARAAGRLLAAPRSAILQRLRRWDRAASQRVSHFVAISQTVRTRIADCYDRDAAVIFPPVDVDYYTPQFAEREDYYLCVSALAPYKRIDLAIEACNVAGRRLVVIGAGPQAARLKKLAGPTVEFLGWQSNEMIRHHLRRCRALLFPGCEDFGIVPLEAQACGTPVVALAEGGAAETVLPASAMERGSGVFFHEQTPAALNAAIDWLESHPAQFSAALAHRHAAQFNPERFERQILAYLQAVMRGDATMQTLRERVIHRQCGGLKPAANIGMHKSITHISRSAEGKSGPHFAPALRLVQPPIASIVVPVYNEQATIATLLERLCAVPLAKEIIVIDDASTDGTRAALAALAQRLPLQVSYKPVNEGKGAAIRTGLALCTGDIVVIQDADLEYDPREIPRLVEKIRRGEADVVYGSRFLRPAGANPPRGSVRRMHRAVNGLLTWLSNRLTGLALTDMETCYKAMRREALDGIEIEQNRFGFEPEITAKLARKKLRFVEVPVSYAPRGYREGKKVKPRDFFSAIGVMLRYAWRK